MHGLLLWIGRLAGSLGALLCVVAGAARLAGSYELGSFQALTLLDVGTAAMVMACLAYVASLADQRRAPR